MSSQPGGSQPTLLPSKNYTKLGEASYARMEKINSDLLALTYGSLVTQLLKDIESVDVVNEQLEKMGYNMGCRLVEEFLAKSGACEGCSDFKEVMEVLAKVGFKMFLGVTAEITQWNAECTVCTLVFNDNPLNDFVELPPPLIGKLNYSNVLCGAIQGAMEQLFMKVSCSYVKDVLNGESQNEIRIELKEVRQKKRVESFFQLMREEFVDEEENETPAPAHSKGADLSSA